MKKVLLIIVLVVSVSVPAALIKRCKRDVEFLSVKFEQMQKINALIFVAAQVNGYTIVDSDGRTNGIKIEPSSGLHYKIAGMFSGKTFFPIGDYTYSFVFPICSKSDPKFKAMLLDLQNPESLFTRLGPSYELYSNKKWAYNYARTYFLRKPDRVLAVKILFTRDCINSFTVNDGDVVVDEIYINIPVMDVKTED